MKKLADFRTKKQKGEKIVMLTAYDYPTAVFQERAGVEILLIGDSVGRNILGYDSEVDVTMEDMLHHVKAVTRGAKRAYVMGDMPYRSFTTNSVALDNARRFIDAGAHGVKMEGEADVVDQIAHVTAAGIDVCAHIGYTPQTDAKATVQGKDFERATELIMVAKQLQAAGAGMIVFELIPELLAKAITEQLDIPTIGIGAGRYCDGQVQVYCDILGLSDRVFRHAKAYDDLGTRYEEIFTEYVKEVKEQRFPTKDNSAVLPDDVAEQVNAWIESI